jgi:hypothetical protein
MGTLVSIRADLKAEELARRYRQAQDLVARSETADRLAVGTGAA